MSRIAQTALLLLAMLGSYVGAVAWGTRATVEWNRQPQELSLPSAEVAKIAALGFQSVLADLYFLQATQYFGNPYNDRDLYKYLGPLVDLVSELDPRYREPLLWGAIAVPRNLGRETWIHTADSTRLLKKGVERFPGDYRFYVFLAYNQAMFHRQYLDAAETLKRARNLPGCPGYVPALITRLYSTAGDLATAGAFAEAVLEETHEENAREKMEERIKDIETEKLLREMDAAAEVYRAQTGRPIGAPIELVTSGILPVLPVEPRGGSWTLDSSGQIISTKMEGRLRINEPGRDPIKPKKEEAVR